jgi:hypothetical protein
MPSTIQVTSIDIGDSSDANNFDEVILFLQADGGTPIRYPFLPNSALPGSVGQTLTLDGQTEGLPPLFVSFEYFLQISAYDKDNGMAFGTADYSGAAQILPGWTYGSPLLTNGKDDSALHPGKKRASLTVNWVKVA